MASSQSNPVPEITPNAQNRYEVTRADLPLSCPMPGMSLWNSHPRVYLPIEASGEAQKHPRFRPTNWKRGVTQLVLFGLTSDFVEHPMNCAPFSDQPSTK